MADDERVAQATTDDVHVYDDVADDGIDGFDFADEAEFDPFAPDEGDIEAQAADEVDELPVMKELPPEHHHTSVFDRSRYASAQDALRELFHRNPARREVYLAIIDFCNDPHTTSEVSDLVERVQKDNFSVYTPLSLCHILESTGALTSQVPETAEAETAEDGTEYLEIKDAPEAIWTSTEEALTLLSELREGNEVHEMVESETEAPYRDIYLRVLRMCAEKPRSAKEIGEQVDDDPLVQNPRRFGVHFIDVLEACGALAWHDKAWNLTELGQRYLQSTGEAAD